MGAKKVIVSDYPDAELIENLNYNIKTCSLLPSTANVIAEGYLWGADPQPLLKHISAPALSFDTLILADVLFNHSCHHALVTTILKTLAKVAEARALVFFTPYRPWLLQEDLAFFNLCREKGLIVQKILERTLEKVMFEEDKGDELLRRTVYGYELKWPIDMQGGPELG